MELYCIKTHSQGIVKEGNIYPLISDKCPCKCNFINVGAKALDELYLPIEKGSILRCATCNTRYISDGFHWLSRCLFANIDSINIEEATECINELQEL